MFIELSEPRNGDIGGVKVLNVTNQLESDPKNTIEITSRDLEDALNGRLYGEIYYVSKKWVLLCDGDDREFRRDGLSLDNLLQDWFDGSGDE